MALMGFVTGALGDVMRRREQSRLEEAEARKEARLAAIRAEERAQDREFTREQFNAQQEAMNTRDERNFEQQKEFFGIQSTEADKRDERNFEQQRQLAAEQRAHAERLAAMRGSGSGSGGGSRNPEIKSYINEATGKVVTFDVNNADDLSRLKKWQESQPVRPYYASSARKPPSAQRTQQAAAAPAPATMIYNPKTGRLEPVGR